MPVVCKGNAEHYRWGEQCDGWHLVKSKHLSVIQERVPVGCSEVRHLHKRSEQFFFVLSGCATLEVDGVVFELHENQGFHVPSNTPHQLSNRGQVELHFTVTSTPPSHGDRIEVESCDWWLLIGEQKIGELEYIRWDEASQFWYEYKVNLFDKTYDSITNNPDHWYTFNIAIQNKSRQHNEAYTDYIPAIRENGIVAIRGLHVVR